VILDDLRLRNFRCFESFQAQFATGFNFIVGANGRGKTSLLEAACVLLRLQSQRSPTLGPAVRIGAKSFVVSGHAGGHRLEFSFGALRRKVTFDAVEQRSPTEYLDLIRVVSFANHDLDLVRGPAELRRRFLDFTGSQIDARYRPTLRAYERALRARNALLKSPQPRIRELAAYTEPLVRTGNLLSEMRAAIVRQIVSPAEKSQTAISGEHETLAIEYLPGNEPDFAAQLERGRDEDLRARVTFAGPHRDDLRLLVDGRPAAQFSSEGQQRTIALALKLAQAHLFAEQFSNPPLLLIDDIFGELDAKRRNALLLHLPNDSQKLVTATSLDWRSGDWDAPILQL
jgi:DNA replication and repair protein RecF